MITENINPNEQSSQSQTKRILKHMLDGGRITSMSALEGVGSFRLSARIYDIKSLGYDVQDEWITLPNGKRVKQYFIEVVE
ncbi:helix-turn-helix domain-containing protein [Actinobacillus pleuropneumoniae]|uniref:Helix-turn-helix domain-containing protein n=1 Tax=Actinobacillus pleuropneumoniae TaxID=715 RepID=A0A9Q4DGR5_ACTPL|nr:helix-turn-helix domain-containing protein [Actinobacillus pleuropneumoniae]MCL7721927.1 helix-turn-helix domain-containing protein [Actinobacillus pleuropneumoniae]MCL7726829.1 helix-turn-helix domain-containing protein [Actinobacillus pleuropneumoniae]MCL7730327.1 helix-turn-helix domain-containing protein [Actinobacillus pleuropneumoniae]MCY6367426.1 helix-turn-helix domain-containing protein [Actinobacillus pleuropneumoniae]MCY6384293.1 helix-turn-helix domain-containing protein [Actino